MTSDERDEHGSYQGRERRRSAMDFQNMLSVVSERLRNFIATSTEDRRYVHAALESLGERLDALSTRLPNWAVWVGWAMAMAVGAMAMFIMTHSWRI